MTASSSSSSNFTDEGLEQYPYPSHVNAASFLSIKLSAESSYVLWRKQMLCLVDSHDMLGFIDGTIKEPKESNGSKAKHREWKRSDGLVQGWIFGSLSEDVMGIVVDLQTAYDVWNTLYGVCSAPSAVHVINGSQQYPYPSHVNTASFLSIKLSGHSNYVLWGKLMLGLVFSHDMIGFIDGSLRRPEGSNGMEWIRSDVLVKGWIFGSMSEDVLQTVVDLHTAHDVWNKLEKMYSPVKSTKTDAITDYWRNDNMGKYIPLSRAIVKGDWEKAKEFFYQDPKALTQELDELGNTAFHVASRLHENTLFFENLLEELDPESLPTLVNDREFTPLQEAVFSDNIKAVKKLVQKNPHLLFSCVGRADHLPLLLAAKHCQRTMFDYLLKASKQHSWLIRDDDGRNPFKGDNAFLLLNFTIVAGFFDVSYDLLKDYYHEMATSDMGVPGETLHLLTRMWVVHGTKRYNFYHQFVYSHVSIGNYSDIVKFSDIENLETYRANDVTRKSYVYHVMERIYFKFWKAPLHVPRIKQLHMDKETHIKALAVMNFILEKASNLKYGDNKEFESLLIHAVEDDDIEIIKLIIQSSPQLIPTLKENKYTLYQLSIINRCENAYLFLGHEVPHLKYLHNTITYNDDQSNLLHLAGKLAPQEKLNMVSGAALQMQRELKWFQEVTKIVTTDELKARNIENETPLMVFRKEHEDLRKKGEEWLKNTANSYTITAALIITIVFAAAITVPGGNNGNTGKAIFKTKLSFIIFIISDAISLFASTISLLLFLSILTARYTYDDFLYKLPKRLIFGLVMLFMSMTTMLIAFGATLYITFGQEKMWTLIPIVAVTCLSVLSFVTLQLPLLVDLISSTYGRGIFVK